MKKTATIIILAITVLLAAGAVYLGYQVSIKEESPTPTSAGDNECVLIQGTGVNCAQVGDWGSFDPAAAVRGAAEANPGTQYVATCTPYNPGITLTGTPGVGTGSALTNCECPVLDVPASGCNTGVCPKCGNATAVCAATSDDTGDDTGDDIDDDDIDTEDDDDVEDDNDDEGESDLEQSKDAVVLCRDDGVVEISYQVIIKNSGTASAVIDQVRDSTDSSLAGFIDESSISPRPESFVNGLIRWAGFTLAAGDSKEFTYKAIIPASYTINNCQAEFDNRVEFTSGNDIQKVTKKVYYNCNCQTLPSTAIIDEDHDYLIAGIGLILFGLIMIRLKVHNFLGKVIEGTVDILLGLTFVPKKKGNRRKKKFEDKITV